MKKRKKRRMKNFVMPFTKSFNYHLLFASRARFCIFCLFTLQCFITVISPLSTYLMENSLPKIGPHFTFKQINCIVAINAVIAIVVAVVVQEIVNLTGKKMQKKKTITA